MKLPSTVVFVLFLAQSVHSATYFVDPINGNDANPGTSTSFPVKTINPRAAALAGPGDTVNLMGTGPFNNPNVSGRNEYFDAALSGTSGNPIIIQSDPGGGQKAVFDPGLPEFRPIPNTAWVLCTEAGAHPDEYVSVNTYPITGNTGAFGAVLQTDGQVNFRLLTYTRIEDMRTNNESFAKVPWDGDSSHGRPIWGDTSNMWRWAYRGPGVFWDDRATLPGGGANPNYRKIHFRASATHWNQPGITDYSGQKDPRQMSLSVTTYPHFAFNVVGDHITFKNIVIQNGGNVTGQLAGSPPNFAENVTFDHVTFNCSRNGWVFTTSRNAKYLHSIFDGNLPSWVCRSDVKDSYDFVNVDGVTMGSNGICRMTSACLFTSGGANDEDMEVANCEFRNGHDGAHVFATRPRVHHNLFENLNDEALMYYGAKPANDVRVYNNVFRKVLVPFSSSEGSWTSTGARYLYRNIADLRVPTLGERSLPPDPLSTWRSGVDFKMNMPIPEIYCYQNTFILPNLQLNDCTAIWTNIDAGTQWQRRFVNNIHLTLQSDKTLYAVPSNPPWPHLSNGNVWTRRKSLVTLPLLTWLDTVPNPDVNYTYSTLSAWLSSSGQSAYLSANGIGWETNSVVANPLMANVGDYVPSHGGTYLNSDYRLTSSSPARNVGMNLTTQTWTGQTPPDSVAPDTTPDIGALPYGASTVSVGVDNSKVFPDSGTPIAEAGDYSLISDADQTGFENISFTSTGSSDPNGSISSYNWVLNGTSISTSASFTKDLPIGTHNVYLTVTDNSGNTATDMRDVTITDPTTHDNLVRNAGFENGASDWILGTGCSVVSTPTHYLVGALRLQGGASFRSTEQSIPCISGTATKVSCWIKTDGIVNGSTRLQLLFHDSAGTPIGSATYLGNPAATTNWTYYSATPTAPAGAASVKVKLLMDGANTGNAYYDDIRFMITDNKLINGSFEKGLANWKQAGDAATITTTLTDVRAGAQAIRMAGGSNYFGWHQDFTASAGVNYTVAGHIKTSGIQAGKIAAIWLEWYNSSNTRIGSTLAVGTSLTGTNPYTLKTNTFTAPANTAYGRVIMRYDGTTGSTAWYDDIYVK